MHRRAATRSTRRTSASRLLPADVQPERRRRRGAVHRPVRVRQGRRQRPARRRRLPLQGSPLDVPGERRDREPRRLLRPRRGQDRARASPSSATTAPTTCPTSIASCSRRASRCSSTRASSRPSAASSARRSGRPTFLESYLGIPVQLPLRAPRSSPRRQRSDNAELQAQPGADLHDGARVPELGERLLHVRQRVLPQPRRTTSSSSRPTARHASATLSNPNVPTALSPQTGLYPALPRRVREPVPDVQRVRRRARRPYVPRRGSRRLRELHAHGREAGQQRLHGRSARAARERRANERASRSTPASSSVPRSASTARSTSTTSRRRPGPSRSSDIQKQQIEYQSFHLAVVRAAQRERRLPLPQEPGRASRRRLQPARRPAPRAPLRSVHRPSPHGALLLQVLRDHAT